MDLGSCYATIAIECRKNRYKFGSLANSYDNAYPNGSGSSTPAADIMVGYQLPSEYRNST